MSVTWFYILTMSVVPSLPGNLFRYKCIQPVTMSSTCQRARNSLTFYEPTVHDCWCFTCWEGEEEELREREEKRREMGKEKESGKGGERRQRRRKRRRIKRIERVREGEGEATFQESLFHPHFINFPRKKSIYKPTSLVKKLFINSLKYRTTTLSEPLCSMHPIFYIK